MRSVATLLANDDARAFAARLDDRSVVHSCVSVTELAECVRTTAPDLIVCDIRDRLGNEVTPALIKEAGRANQIMLRIALTSANVRSMLELLKASLDVEVVIAGYDSLGKMIAHAAGVPDRPAQARAAVLKRYGLLERERASSVVIACILVGLPHGTVASVATACGVSTRSLARTMAIARLPSASQSLAWSCCLQVVWLLEIGDWSTKEIAHYGGFGSTQALSHFVERHTGRPPVRLSRETGFAQLFREWARRFC